MVLVVFLGPVCVPAAACNALLTTSSSWKAPVPAPDQRSSSTGSSSQRPVTAPALAAALNEVLAASRALGEHLGAVPGTPVSETALADAVVSSALAGFLEPLGPVSPEALHLRSLLERAAASSAAFESLSARAVRAAASPGAALELFAAARALAAEAFPDVFSAEVGVDLLDEDALAVYWRSLRSRRS